MRSFIEKVVFEFLIILLSSAVMFVPFMLLMGAIHSQDPRISAIGAKDAFELTVIFAATSSIVRFGIKSLLRKKPTS